MFGLGGQEILILLVLGAVPLVAVLVALAGSRRSGGGRVARLEEENRRLRDELDHRDGS